MTTLATRNIGGTDMLIFKEPGRSIGVIPVEDGDWTPAQKQEVEDIIEVFIAAQEPVAVAPSPAQVDPSVVSRLIPRSLFLVPAPKSENRSQLFNFWVISTPLAAVALVVLIIWRVYHHG